MMPRSLPDPRPENDRDRPMTRDELRESVRLFCEDLNAKVGVKLDPDVVWKEVQHKMRGPAR